ncbi:winged helix-turn-helix domain-containing protein [Capnocytophaga granulosa]|uniref:winged helix-turn-helix domain-containing protein n=1 Tax=Capnocytophaga granulosa TaxID=45242 RepID=UPI003857D828
MKVLGYVNRFSRGVYRVQKELEENRNGKASFDFSLITAFRVVEPISTTYFEEGFGEESDNKSGESTNKLGESTDKTPNKSTDKKEESTNKSTDKKEESTNKFTNKIEEEILKVIIDNPFYNRKKLSEIFGRTEEGIGYYLKKLTKAGVIKREGAKKNGKWVVVEREELEK